VYFLIKLCHLQLTQANAFKACCSMGMALVTYETKAEQMCIAKYNLGRLLLSLLENTIPDNAVRFLDVMKLKDVDYWTGASDLSCFKKFMWCSGKALVDADFQWTPLGQRCVVLRVDYGVTVMGMFVKGADGFNDLKCTDQLSYICEEPPTA
jgi:hypothetical protein